jgi:segregation and condensation protein B
MMELKSVIEALLFASQNPLSVAELRSLLAAAIEHSDAPEVKALKKTKADAIQAVLEALRHEHETAGRTFRLACVAESWQFVTQPDYAPWLRALAGERARPARLSAPALETLTIVAYRQPITRAEIEQIRGVSVDGVIQTLLERELVEQVGRAEVVGRPATYGTTRKFLEYFGLGRLEELPGGDELRRIPVTRPPSLLTVEPGLATAPPDQLLPDSQNPSPPGPEPAAPGTDNSAQATAEPAPDVSPVESDPRPEALPRPEP